MDNVKNNFTTLQAHSNAARAIAAGPSGPSLPRQAWIAEIGNRWANLGLFQNGVSDLFHALVQGCSDADHLLWYRFNYGKILKP